MRFDDKSNVAGYDSEKYRAFYNENGGDLNQMRQALREIEKKSSLSMNLQFFAKKHKSRKVSQSDPLWDSLVQGDVEKQLKDQIFTWKHGEYAVRFDDKSNVAGYDPEKIKAQFENEEGYTWDEKLKNMRRKQYN